MLLRGLGSSSHCPAANILEYGLALQLKNLAGVLHPHFSDCALHQWWEISIPGGINKYFASHSWLTTSDEERISEPSIRKYGEVQGGWEISFRYGSANSTSKFNGCQRKFSRLIVYRLSRESLCPRVFFAAFGFLVFVCSWSVTPKWETSSYISAFGPT